MDGKWKNARDFALGNVHTECQGDFICSTNLSYQFELFAKPNQKEINMCSTETETETERESQRLETETESGLCTFLISN